MKLGVLLEEDHPPWEGIRKAAEAWNADLIVVGTRGASNLRYVLLGSTAEHMLEHTDASVLAVKPGKFRSPVS